MWRADMEEFAHMFEDVADPRRSNATLHDPDGMPMIGLLSAPCGGGGCADMERFGRAKEGFPRGLMRPAHGIPSRDAFSNLFNALDSGGLTLKDPVEGRKKWCRLADGTDHFETRWKPKSWNAGHRLIPVGKRIKRQHEQPIQPDLFRPVEYGCEFKVIVTNRRTDPCDVVAFHEGRGSQEGILAEPGTHCRMDYMPVGTRVGNQPYMFAGIPAYNYARELQIQIDGRARGTTPKRAALRCFREMETLQLQKKIDSWVHSPHKI